MARQIAPRATLSERIREGVKDEIKERETALWSGFDGTEESTRALPYKIGVIRGLVTALEIVKQYEENPEDED